MISLGGYKIKWNQLVTQDVPQDFAGNYGTTVRKEAFGNYTVIAEHKYYCKLSGTNVPVFYGLVTYNTPFEQISTAVQTTSPSYIFTSTRTTQAAVWTYESNGESYTGVLANVFDLTEMFGPGSEPTIEEFEAMFGTEYRPYDEGTEMNILQKMELNDELSVKSTGFNQWDEEWEIGSFNAQGQPTANSHYIRSKNYIEVLPDTEYYFISGTNPQRNYNYFSALCYDGSKNFIGYAGTSLQNRTYTEFRTLPNTKYIMFLFGDTSDQYVWTTYNHDICINLSDPAKNGTYLPYTTSTQDLSWIYDLEYTPSGSTTPEKLFPYGLLSAGSVHDEVTDTGAVKRVGVVDLGEYYSYMNYYEHNGHYYAEVFIQNYKKYSPNLLVPFGETTTAQQIYNGKYGVGPRPNGNSINVAHPSNPSTHEQFINTVTGILLYYELETPITVTFPSPKDLGYNVQSGGTEQLLPTNPAGTGPITAPIIESVNYPLDAVGTLTNLPRNYISVESMDSFTTALGNILNLNITKTWDSTNNKWSFSVTSRS